MGGREGGCRMKGREREGVGREGGSRRRGREREGVG